ncbi:transcriptional regulator, HxlR family [Sphingobium chlorophenolicum L-1]|uniref:Transcriptional regulator, HxlR family n=2 Tax=Sphingobium chlorophenolicum TaxID=46429 RepID=F6F226_SPHCR|nr:helix-turn-helix domain-containing protein [Sphingobium chlorophenolicum]AAM96657.1 unknown [Sphingobium chlorophenolicum L-1]AEG51592.1 transcriptional regulator, HxlR family [Sphingobium chlorophenolicum L-1]
MFDTDTAHRPTNECLKITEVLARVGDKWSILVIGRLGDRSMRFNELRRSVEGVSQRMLTLTLRGLERDGLITRTVTSSIPPRVDYELTGLGRSLLVPVEQLARWAQEHRPTVEIARREFDLKMTADTV